MLLTLVPIVSAPPPEPWTFRLLTMVTASPSTTGFADGVTRDRLGVLTRGALRVRGPLERTLGR